MALNETHNLHDKPLDTIHVWV